MNKGTLEGTIEEVRFVKILNKKLKKEFWKVLNLNHDYNYAIHVIFHQPAKINDTLIKPKADIFIAKGNVSQRYLIKKDFYLNENDLEPCGLKPLNKSGISVKRPDSKRYQILKMNPSTFKKVFGCFELGAGASIYCNRENELIKNNYVLKGWNTNWKRFEEYFKEINGAESLKNEDILSEVRLNTAKRIKSLSNKIIGQKIEDNEKISKFVFQGIGNLEEPYTAYWLYDFGKLKRAGKIPFVVTTGSGRSRGDFTIVIKPK